MLAHILEIACEITLAWFIIIGLLVVGIIAYVRYA